MEIIEKRDKKSGQSLSPVIYSWVNITCHPEALQWFGLSYFSVPTIVYYVPKDNKFIELIGTFNDQTVLEYEQKFVSGRLPLRQASVSQEQMKVSSVDCAAQ